jgi:hypothetical protein
VEILRKLRMTVFVEILRKLRMTVCGDPSQAQDDGLWRSFASSG